MAEQVRIDVTATDNASQVLDDVADKTERIEDAKPELRVDADVSKALSSLDQLNEAARANAVAAEALGDALGPELTSRVNMDGVIAELKQLGVSTEQITANADQLAAKLKEIDSPDLGGRLGQSLGTARGQLEATSDAARGARSATANMFGNVAGEAAGLSGVMGPLNVSLGQFVEYGSEAKLSGQGLASVLGDMSKMIGPMAALAIGMEVLSAAMTSAKASKAFDAANVTQYFDALADGTTAVESFNEEIAKTGELSYRTQHGGGPLGMFSSTKDLLPVLERAHSDVAQLNTIIDDYVTTQDFSGAANDRWRASLEKAGVSQLDAIEIVKAARQEAQARIDATDKETRVTALLGDSQAAQADKARAAAASERERGLAMDAANAAAEGQQRIAQDTADMLDRVNGLLQEQVDKLTAQGDAFTTAADAQIAEQDALRTYADTLGDVKASTDDVRDSAIALAQAHVATAEAQAASSGATLTATQKLDAQNAALLNTAATAKGPARQAILDYIFAVNQTPPEKRTEFQAAINAGDVATAQKILDDTSAPRKAYVNAEATNVAQTEQTLASLARNRTMMISVGLNPNYGAALGPITSGPRSVNPSTAAAPAVGTVNMHLPAGWRGDPLAAVHDSARRSGRLYRRAGR
jgi:hypothetical protein